MAKDIKDEKRKVATLLQMGGMALQEIYYGLAGSHDEESFEEAKSRLDAHFISESNVTFERHIYRKIKQSKEESFDKFVMRIKHQADKCGFGMRQSEFVRDQIVEGTCHDKVREEIFKINDCSLDDALTVGRSYETLQQKMATFMKLEQKSSLLDKNDLNMIKSNSFEQPKGECYRCGKMGHYASSPSCPGKTAKCNRCNKIGHFMAKCHQSSGRKNFNEKPYSRNQRENVIRNIQEEPVNIPEIGYLFHLNGSNSMKCSVGGVLIEMIIDSGASGNMITSKTWKLMKERKVKLLFQNKETDRTFFAYGQRVPLVLMGMFDAEISHGKRTVKARFYVVEAGQHNLLSKQTAEHLEVLKVGLIAETTGNPKSSVQEVKVFPTIKNILVSK